MQSSSPHARAMTHRLLGECDEVVAALCHHLGWVLPEEPAAAAGLGVSRPSSESVGAAAGVATSEAVDVDEAAAVLPGDKTAGVEPGTGSAPL